MKLSFKRFPSDAEFENALRLKDIYNFRNKKYFLIQLENYGRKELVNIAEYTIEHILPQTHDLHVEWINMLGENWQEIQQEYLHTIGNITLTGYNSELSDRPFNEKKNMIGGFNNSPLNLNKFMQTVDSWGENEIIARSKELFTQAKLIWRYPICSALTLERYKQLDVDAEKPDYSLDSYEYLTGEMFDLFKKLQLKILNLDDSITMKCTRHYIGFKAFTNFVYLYPRKSKLRLELMVTIDQINDPYTFCKVRSKDDKHWVELSLFRYEDLEYVVDLIRQTLNFH